MFLSKLPVSSFLLAATSIDEIYQVIFLFLTFKCFCVFHAVKEKAEAYMTRVPNASLRALQDAQKPASASTLQRAWDTFAESMQN
jgi:hypothetical protein